MRLKMKNISYLLSLFMLFSFVLIADESAEDAAEESSESVVEEELSLIHI